MRLHGRVKLGAASMGAVLLLATLVGAVGPQTAASAAGRSSPVNPTVVVSGFGFTGEFLDASYGAAAYFDAVNASGELKGVKIDYTGFTNDGQSPSGALAAIRGLVTQQHVFGLVPDISQYNPANSYLASQHLVAVGESVGVTSCSNKPSTSVWMFGWNGCLVPQTPSFLPDQFGQLSTYAKAKTGSSRPTFLDFGFSSSTGTSAARNGGIEAKGAGFKVVGTPADIPNPPAAVSDYSPYIQQWLKADNGKQPQVIMCYAVPNCIPIYPALRAAGFTGIFYQPFGVTPAIGKTMAGSTTFAYYNSDPTNAGLIQLNKDLSTYEPGKPFLSYATPAGYFAAAMFVQALKKAGNNDTPQNVQKILSTQTWTGIKNFAGPTIYPASTVGSSPFCQELISDNADGSFTILHPFACTNKTFKA